MHKPGLNDSYDVVIIGAGVGGLTAAALLSRSGYRVCVVEKEPHAGGYLAGFRRKSFLFDTAIHWLNQYGKGGLIRRVFDLIGSDYPVAVDQQRIRRYQGKEFSYLLTHKPDDLRDELIRDFPHEEAGIRRFFASAYKIGRSFKEFNTVFLAKENMSVWDRIKSMGKTIRFVMPFIPYVMYSGEKGLKKGLNKYFKDPRLHRIFAGEHELIGCFVPIGWAYFGDFQSPPKGGSQQIPKWLQHQIQTRGGSVIFQSKVEEVLLENNRAVGIRLNHRNKHYTIKSRYVIAANDIETLYEKLLPQHAIPSKLKDKLRNAELYTSSVTLSIALDCPAEQLGFDEEMIHLVDEFQSYEAYLTGNPATAEISILAASVRDKSLCPDHQGTLTIYMPAEMKYEENWQTTLDENGQYVRGEAYKQLKQKIAEVLLERVEQSVAPGLRSHILFYEVATPVTHYRYTGNKNGTMMGARPGKANMQAKIAHYQTPVQNLILGGHWAELGGGVPIAVKAGANAALLILKTEKPSLFKLMAGYMDDKTDLTTVLAHPDINQESKPFQTFPTPAERAAAPTGQVGIIG